MSSLRRVILSITFILYPFIASTTELHLTKGSVHPYFYDKRKTEIISANPDVVDVQVTTPGILYIFGKKTGTTKILLTNPQTKEYEEIILNISPNLDALKADIKLLSSKEIHVSSLSNGIEIKGEVETAELAHSIENLAKNNLQEKQVLINNLKVSTPTQVYLKVKIAEVRKRILNKIGISWQDLFSPTKNRYFSFGVLSGRNGSGAGAGGIARANSIPPMNTLFAKFTDGVTSMTALLDALETEGLASTLAQPTLVATSGETASFLVGGEFPYPMPQGVTGSITVEFKEFGVKLSFTPTILSPERIHLRVRPEVSEIDETRQITLPLSSNGDINLPSLRTRRAETSVQLSDGQSLAIAGLFSSTISNALNSFPLLSEVPILGDLFSSTEFQQEETELVIIVTPYLVEPVSQEKMLALPTDTIAHASPFEMITTQSVESKKERSPIQVKPTFYTEAQ